MPDDRIYLDHSATTPVDPRVAEAMTRSLTQNFGNPSSVHGFGQQARAAVDRARREVAALINAKPNEIIFTSGGTEGNNLAIRGICEVAAAHGRHIVTSAIEHPSVRGVCSALEQRGWEVTRLPVYDNGIVRVEDVRDALRPDTVLVTVMLANNEIGTIQPIAAIAAIAHEHGALMHTDAVQSTAKIPVDVRALGIDLLTLSAHKFNGPKGAGALWIKRGTRMLPILTGGKHERNRRAGTENVPAIVGLGVAARLAAQKLASEAVRVAALRDRLEQGIVASVPGTMINGDLRQRVPNTTNISFDRVEAESLLIALDLEGIAVSTGSACSSGTLEPSHVLRAMGFSAHRTQNSLRFSLGQFSTDAEVQQVLDVLPRLVEKLRGLTKSTAAARP